MNQYSHFSIEGAAVIRPQVAADPGEWRLLRRLHIPDRFNDPQGGTVRRAVVVDVETTGLSTETDDVIQLALLSFDYDMESGRILTVHKAHAFEGLRQPAVPISEEAALITGITDDMVAGKFIDADAVTAIVADAGLIIAHNASFDPRHGRKALVLFRRQAVGLHAGRHRLASGRFLRWQAGLPRHAVRLVL